MLPRNKRGITAVILARRRRQRKYRSSVRQLCRSHSSVVVVDGRGQHMSFVLPRNRSQHWLYYYWVGILRTTMRLSTVPLRRLKLRLMRMITFPMKDPSSCLPRRFCGFKKDRAGAGGQAVAPRGLFRHALDRAEGREGGREKYPGYLARSGSPLRIQFVGSGHEYFKLVSIEKAFFRSYLKEKENVLLQLMVAMLSSLCIKENSNMTKLHKAMSVAKPPMFR